MNPDEDNDSAFASNASSVDDGVVEEDETEFRVEDNGSPSVNGVQMKRGAPFNSTPISVLKDAVLRVAPHGLSNGSDTDFHRFATEVVVPKNTNVHDLTTQLVSLFILWSPKRKNKNGPHFFADAYFAQKVISLELRIDFQEFLVLRGWAVKRRKKSDEEVDGIDIIYRRVHDCLTYSFPHVVEKHKQLMAMLHRVYTHLKSPQLYGATSLNEKMDVPKNNDDLPLRKISMFGNSKLIDIDTKQKTSLPSNRFLLEHQHLQLAFYTIKVSFTPIMLPTKRLCPRYHEKLFGLIFKDCRTRRQLLEGLQAILMYCKDDHAIQESKTTLRSWLDTPTEILTLARRASGTSSISSAEGYVGRVWRSLLRLYAKKSSKDHTYRSTAGQRLVVQIVVYIKLKILNENNSTLVTSPSFSLTKTTKKRRNTTVDDSSGPSKAAKNKVLVPERVLYDLSSMPKMLLAPETGPAFDDQDHTSTNKNQASTNEHDATSTNNQPQTSPVAALTPTTSWFIPYDDVRRWSTPITRMATETQMRSVSARLVIEYPDYEILLHHSPFELYVAWELHDTYHQFEVKPKKDPSYLASLIQSVPRATLNIPDIGDLYSIKRDFVVARPGCAAFDQVFIPDDFFQIDCVLLVQFIFEHGHNDEKRSTRMPEISLPKVGMRVDFGNAGQAMEEPAGLGRPKTLCGDDSFENDKNGETIKGLLGRIVDGICNCSHYLSEKVVCRPSVMNQRRFTEFALPLRDFLYAADSDVEWITLQLLNLSHYQGGVRHKDVSNDPREGYNRTMCLCIHFTDGVGDLWSLKIITGFRKRVGDHFDGAMGKLLTLKSSLVLHTTSIDAGYIDILRLYKGNYIPKSIPTWKEPHSMWLDDDMPYEVKVLKGGREIESFSMVTGTTLSNWFSPALTGAYLLAPFTSVRGMVQLAVIAACQNSFEHYYIVTQNMLGRLIERKKNHLLADMTDNYPMLRYCDTCTRLFSNQQTGSGGGTSTAADFGLELVGGEYAPPRFSPVSFDFRTVFGSDRKKVDLLVDELMSLLRSVNGILGSQSLEVCRSTLDPRLNDTRKRLRKVLPGCELSPIRLLVFLEFCAHLNMGLFKTKKIRNLLYPISGTASHRFILDNQFNDSQADGICFFLQSELSTPSREVFMDEIEPMLCAAAQSKIEDTYIKGQYLFRLDEHGTALMKVYKAPWWTPVPQTKNDELTSDSDSD